MLVKKSCRIILISKKLEKLTQLKKFSVVKVDENVFASFVKANFNGRIW